MELSTAAVGWLLIVAIVVALAALATSWLALAGQRRVRHAYRAFSRGSREDVMSLLARHVAEVEALRGEVAGLGSYSEELRALIGRGVSRVATVRYDAFEDMGGQVSFSTALLDERGNGLVLSCLNGRTETRAYAKTVKATDSEHFLSDEEREAIALALQQQGGQPVEVPARSRPYRVRQARNAS